MYMSRGSQTVGTSQMLWCRLSDGVWR